MTAPQKKNLRRFLMIVGPAAVIVVSGIFYLFSGRFISTDNAYIKQNKIMVAPEVSGLIIPSNVGDNQAVHKGDVLFTVNPVPFKIEVDKASANLAAVRTQIEGLKASARQKDEEIKIAQSDAQLSETEYNRRTGPGMKNAVSAESVNEARHARDVAQTKIAQLEQERASILAQLNGSADTPSEQHPLYKAAQAALDTANLNLERTTVRAPVDGITGGMPNNGDYAHASIPSLSLVESGDVWLEANFKETEITRMKPGQKVDIKIDTYPDRDWKGSVESISPATGSEFSILPAQNATGNWVKVVQRVAVRIRPELKKDDPPLRTGTSATVTVDTGSYPHL